MIYETAVFGTETCCIEMFEAHSEENLCFIFKGLYESRHNWDRKVRELIIDM